MFSVEIINTVIRKYLLGSSLMTISLILGELSFSDIEEVDSLGYCNEYKKYKGE